MYFNPIKASAEIMKYYLRYIETTFFINDKEYFKQFRNKLEDESYFSKGPYLEATDSFKLGKSLNQLISEGEVSPLFKNLNKKAMPPDRPLYLHQEQSIRCLNKGRNAVITTGTGSGKTESFLLPIINYIFREQERGELNSGVRALLIYPMNALANDQIKRLRTLLKGTKITFGSYTGETETTHEKALAKYRKLNGNEEPAENEIISREAIKKNPPHLLITNYAMLEYLMLRPEDNSIFSGEYAYKWKFIVLDEAHTYIGATGIEVAMLLKRLKARLETENTIQYILTSATLGTSEKDNDEVISFANTLCSVDNFRNENVIRAVREKVCPVGELCDFPSEMYNDVYSCIEEYNSNNVLFDKAKKYYSELEKGVDIDETIYNLMSADRNYYKLKSILDDTVVSIYDVMQSMNMNSDNMASFISLASKGRKNGISLFDARYHYFIRTLEGAYLTLPPDKMIFIEPRKNYLDRKVFKFSVCKSCGEIYIFGQRKRSIEDGLEHLVSEVQISEKSSQTKMEYYILDAEKLGITENLSESSELPDEGFITNSYILCGKCGAISRKFDVKSSMKRCSCGSEFSHTVVKIDDKNMANQPFSGKPYVKNCVCCGKTVHGASVLRDFYMGQTAAASVIGTALYGEIPSKKTIVHTIKTEAKADEFGFSSVQSETVTKKEIKKLSKQYLIFSDSRQEAAYFAGYFDLTYHNLLRRRILVDVLMEHISEYAGGVLPSTLCRHLEAAFSKYEIFEPERRKEEALITIMNEMVSDDRNGLEGLGIISFQYKHKFGELPVFPNGETNTVINVLANGFRKKSAIKYESITDLSDEDKEYFQYSSAVQTIALNRENQSEKFASRSTWTSEHQNSRINYLSRLTCRISGTSWNIEKINAFLTLLWDRVFVTNNSIETHDNVGYRMLIDEFVIHSAYSDKIKKYRCSKCGKITVNNADSVCPEMRCYGNLEEFDENEIRNNHYYKIYTELDIYDLVIKEHTAQLDIETAKKYQDSFVNKEINVLSCSTTFEMGVDVGNLETVFMKNMPPTPANYIQRAGRAGRRTDSAAYALTFCRLSSHDLNFYRTPEKMIKGHILPPSFKISNEKIVKRHLNACCLSEFFRIFPESFHYVEDFLLTDYFNKFCSFIESRPKGLMKIIYESIPQELHNRIESWLNNLTDKEGSLYDTYNQTISDIKQLTDYAEELVKKGTPNELKVASNVKRAVDTIKQTELLSFLSRKSILPKYGFPVDSVELLTSPTNFNFRNTSKLRLSRDLSIAIAEYAPDSEIIADGKIYKSRYIKLPPNKSHTLIEHQYGICTNPECGSVNTSINRFLAVKKCKICGSTVEPKGSYIIPQYGFIAEQKSKKATTKAPERTYRGEVNYIGNSSGITNEFNINNITVSITKTKDDELLVMNRTAFYMCRNCGYAYKKQGGITEPIQISKEKHRTATGSVCENQKFERLNLGHNLKTDVAIINISEPFEENQAISVLYALLEGVSSYYSIERNDISGCLHYAMSKGNLHTVFVLYDTVPGGAGHVSRIAVGGNEAVIGILKEAYRIVNECSCGGENGDGACYSCLCNYENQRVHERLNRGMARKYIGKILNIK